MPTRACTGNKYGDCEFNALLLGTPAQGKYAGKCAICSPMGLTQSIRTHAGKGSMRKALADMKARDPAIFERAASLLPSVLRADLCSAAAGIAAAPPPLRVPSSIPTAARIPNHGNTCYLAALLQACVASGAMPDPASPEPSAVEALMIDAAAAIRYGQTYDVRAWQSQLDTWKYKKGRMHDPMDLFNRLVDNADSMDRVLRIRQTSVIACACGISTRPTVVPLETPATLVLAPDGVHNTSELVHQSCNRPAGYDQVVALCPTCSTNDDASARYVADLAPAAVCAVEIFRTLDDRSPKNRARCEPSDIMVIAGARYALASLVVHRGPHIVAGHYVAYHRVGEGWVLYDDDARAELFAEKPNEVDTDTALAFYRRMGPASVAPIMGSAAAGGTAPFPLEAELSQIVGESQAAATEPCHTATADGNATVEQREVAPPSNPAGQAATARATAICNRGAGGGLRLPDPPARARVHRPRRDIWQRRIPAATVADTAAIARSTHAAEHDEAVAERPHGRRRQARHRDQRWSARRWRRGPVSSSCPPVAGRLREHERRRRIRRVLAILAIVADDGPSAWRIQ